jgi:hypothetical protein
MATPLAESRSDEQSVSVKGIRVVAAIGLAVSIGVLFLVGWAPDDGPTGVSLRQAIALAVVFAAAPTAVWLAPTDSHNVVSVGGGWAAAGGATMLGGNVLMAIAIPYGLLILWLGAAHRPPLTARLVARLLLTVVTFIVAVVCALGTGVATGIGAFMLATIVAGSSLFGSTRPGKVW